MSICCRTNDSRLSITSYECHVVRTDFNSIWCFSKGSNIAFSVAGISLFLIAEDFIECRELSVGFQLQKAAPGALLRRGSQKDFAAGFREKLPFPGHGPP